MKVSLAGEEPRPAVYIGYIRAAATKSSE